MTTPDKQTTYEKLSERYATDQVPWDHELPPPEVLALIPTLPPGRALDVGCGYGRASIFMALQGWQVDGIDFVPKAIEVARQRALSNGVTINFHLGDMTNLDFLSGSYDFALDVGCSHSLDSAGLRLYHGELLRLLRQGATYLLFAHLREPDSAEPQRWMDEGLLLSVFANGFKLVDVEHGSTTTPSDTWRSAWYQFVRL
jgi:SAM-dependent methyltransferase